MQTLEGMALPRTRARTLNSGPGGPRGTGAFSLADERAHTALWALSLSVPAGLPLALLATYPAAGHTLHEAMAELHRVCVTQAGAPQLFMFLIDTQ